MAHSPGAERSLTCRAIASTTKLLPLVVIGWMKLLPANVEECNHQQNALLKLQVSFKGIDQSSNPPFTRHLSKTDVCWCCNVWQGPRRHKSGGTGAHPSTIECMAGMQVQFNSFPGSLCCTMSKAHMSSAHEPLACGFLLPLSCLTPVQDEDSVAGGMGWRLCHEHCPSIA